jgi:hypothetical protein
VQQANVEDTHVFMPGFPLLRYLPKWAVSSSSIDKEGTSCSKYFNSHSGLTPGVFTFFCPHDVCIGFKLMHKHEGPSTVHDTLFTRLDNGTHTNASAAETGFTLSFCINALQLAGPAAIIYDNACNLHKYCVRRTPNFICKTRFLIDRLHQFNHHR